MSIKTAKKRYLSIAAQEFDNDMKILRHLKETDKDFVELAQWWPMVQKVLYGTRFANLPEVFQQASYNAPFTGTSEIINFLSFLVCHEIYDDGSIIAICHDRKSKILESTILKQIVCGEHDKVFAANSPHFCQVHLFNGNIREFEEVEELLGNNYFFIGSCEELLSFVKYEFKREQNWRKHFFPKEPELTPRFEAGYEILCDMLDVKPIWLASAY